MFSNYVSAYFKFVMLIERSIERSLYIIREVLLSFIQNLELELY